MINIKAMTLRDEINPINRLSAKCGLGKQYFPGEEKALGLTLPIDYILPVEIGQIGWQPWCVWQSKIDLIFVAPEDVVEALEGGAQPEASMNERWLDKVGVLSSLFSKNSILASPHGDVRAAQAPLCHLFSKRCVCVHACVHACVRVCYRERQGEGDCVEKYHLRHIHHVEVQERFMGSVSVCMVCLGVSMGVYPRQP